MVRKVTFTLDDETVRRIDSAATRLKMPKSQVVREAVADYAARADRLSEAEKQRMLRAIRDLVPQIPRRSAKDVDREIEEIRKARRSGGRGK